MNITAHDQTNRQRTITFRTPNDAVIKALASHEGYSWRVSRSTALRVGRASKHGLTVRTQEGPLDVLIQQDGPGNNDFFITLYPVL